MPISGSSNSAANKNMMSRIWTNGVQLSYKTLWEKNKLLVTSNFFFSHNVFKSCLLLTRQNEYLWSKGLKYGNIWKMTICSCVVVPSLQVPGRKFEN